MKCSKCGNEIKEGQRFCTNCGMTVGTMNQETPTPQKVPSPQRIDTPTPHRVDDKGFLRDLASVIAHPRAAVQGAQRQAEREDEVRSLLPIVSFTVTKSEKRLVKLLKEYKDQITYDDQTSIESKINELKGYVNADPTGLSPTKIKNTLSQLERAFYDLETKLGAPHEQDSVPRENNRSHVSVLNLQNIHEDELSVVRGKAVWGIQPGQIARRISERELVEASELDGFIIQHGCSAMIFVNGELIDVFESGRYDIPNKNEQFLKAEYDKIYDTLSKEAAEQKKKFESEERDRRRNLSISERGGLVGIAGTAIKSCWEFIFGARHSKSSSGKNSEEERLLKLKKETEKLLKKKYPFPLLSVVLVSNQTMTLIFGGSVTEKGVEYKPYNVQTRLFDVQIGVRLQLIVSDIGAFTTNYLADKNTFTMINAFELIDKGLENQLNGVLRTVDYKSEGLSDELKAELSLKIKELINGQLFGLTCSQVLDITDRSEDFDKFRNEEREIYKTEKEIDYFTRTGECRNRLEIEANRQLINSATNEEECRHALQQINRDKLLHDDELEEFVLLLSKQKQIRNATTQEEIFEATQDLLKSNLIKQDDVEALQDALINKKLDRKKIADIMRIQSMLSVEYERLRSGWTLSDMTSDHDWEREIIDRKRSWGIESEELEHKWQIEENELQQDLKRRRMQDAYNDERGDKDFDQKKREDDYNFGVEQRQQQANWEHHTREVQEQRENDTIQYARERQDKFDESDILNRNAEEAKRRLLDIQESERKTEAQKMAHDENIHSMDVSVEKERVNAHTQMSAEQIAASYISKLSPEAQVAFTEALSSGKVNEILTKQKSEFADVYQQMLEIQKEQSLTTQDLMLKMSQMMQQGMVGIGQQQLSQQQQLFNQQQQHQEERLQDQMRMKEEYHENMIHQQHRTDQTQETALDNIGQVSSAAANNLNAFNGGLPEGTSANIEKTSSQQETFPCPYCGKPVAAWQSPCPHCNNEIRWQ